MPSNGFTASQLSLPQRTALFNFSLFPLLTSCIVYIIYIILKKKKKKKKKKRVNNQVSKLDPWYSHNSSLIDSALSSHVQFQK